MATTVTQFKERNPQWGQSFDRLAWLKEQAAKEQKAQAPKSKKGSGNQSWLSSIISELSGAGGAAGGAAAGAALGSVVPGIGNIVGAIGGGIAGGFLGGTGGRLVENQIRDNEMRLADALKEGAWSGAFGGVGPAFQGVRGLQALGKGSIGAGTKALSGISDDVARATAGKALARGGKKAGQALLSQGDDLTGALSRITSATGNLNKNQIRGNTFQANAMGVGQGAKAPGIQAVTAQESDEILKVLGPQGFNIKSKAAEKAQRELGTKLAQTTDELAKFYKSGIQLSDDVANQLGDDILNQAKSTLGWEDLSANAKKQFTAKINRIKNTKDVDKLWDIVKEAGRNSNFGKGASSKLVQQEGLNRIIRANGAKVLGNAVPESQVLNRLYSTGAKAQDLMLQASKQADRSGLTALITTSQPFRTAEASIGRGVGAIGSGQARVAGAVPASVKGVVRGAAVRGIANQATSQPMPQEGEQVDPMQQEIDMLQGSMVGGGGGLSQALGGEQMPQQSNNPFSPQNAQSAVAQILAQGGDFKDVKDYLAIVEVMSELNGGMGGQPELTANQRNKMIQLQSVGQELSTLRNEVLQSGLFQSDNQLSASLGGFYDSTIGRLTDQQKKVYQDQLKTRGIQLVRALGEVGNLSEAEQEAAIKNLPAPGDTMAGAMQKLQQLEDRFNNLSLIVQQGGGGSVNIADLLQQAY